MLALLLTPAEQVAGNPQVFLHDGVGECCTTCLHHTDTATHLR